MISGYSIVNGEPLKTGAGVFAALNPSTGETLEPQFHDASIEDLNQAAGLAAEAVVSYHQTAGRERAEFLRQISAGIEAISSELVARAHAETALTEARLNGELARTTAQLRLFARMVEDGSWVDARIDLAEPERKPLPRPDLRSMLRPIGTVAVFGASNFPLAFSVAGGDTASALAAGNPVLVKGHPAHPGTSELVAQVIANVVRERGLHPGVFALLFGSNELGAALVRHRSVRAVGFTGSLAGGKALMDICAGRPDPIPCFTEMSSVNPVFVLPGALRENAAKIAAGLFASFTLGVGQFCTKPGLVYLPANEDGDAFLADLKQLVEKSGCPTMLTEGISRSYRSGVNHRSSKSAVRSLAQASAPAGLSSCSAIPALFEIDARDFLKESDLTAEIFGPSTLIVRFESREEMLALANALEGQLTATLHGTEDDLIYHPDLIGILERKAGRLIVNGFPTGVEVTHAMVHGGPFPATSDSRFTSVGALAIYRWVRPVCYQDFPQSCLLDELKNENPLGIVRMVNGTLTRDAVGQKPEHLHGAHVFNRI